MSFFLSFSYFRHSISLLLVPVASQVLCSLLKMLTRRPLRERATSRWESLTRPPSLPPLELSVSYEVLSDSSRSIGRASEGIERSRDTEDQDCRLWRG